LETTSQQTESNYPDFYVDPNNIPPPETLTKAQKEFFVLFGIVVAGKTAKTQVKKLCEFLNGEGSPFEQVRTMEANGTLESNAKAVKLGQYTRILHAIEMASYLDVDDELSVYNLELIKGIGPKTARFVMLYTDPDPQADYIPLDTHVLKFLKTQKVANVPKATPSNPKHYRRLEKEFRRIAKEKGLTIRQLDTIAWQRYTRDRAKMVKFVAERSLKTIKNLDRIGAAVVV
jgi:endonuclease III